MWKLYDLIWRRFVACQMVAGEWDSTTVSIRANTAIGEAEFRASESAALQQVVVAQESVIALGGGASGLVSFPSLLTLSELHF